MACTKNQITQLGDEIQLLITLDIYILILYSLICATLYTIRTKSYIAFKVFSVLGISIVYWRLLRTYNLIFDIKIASSFVIYIAEEYKLITKSFKFIIVGIIIVFLRLIALKVILVKYVATQCIFNAILDFDVILLFSTPLTLMIFVLTYIGVTNLIIIRFIISYTLAKNEVRNNIYIPKIILSNTKNSN
jgi:hypothetical protein